MIYSLSKKLKISDEKQRIADEAYMALKAESYSWLRVMLVSYNKITLNQVKHFDGVMGFKGLLYGQFDSRNWGVFGKVKLGSKDFFKNRDLYAFDQMLKLIDKFREFMNDPSADAFVKPEYTKEVWDIYKQGGNDELHRFVKAKKNAK